MENWLDITYPYIFQNSLVWYLWKRAFCPHGWHLFDEVWSIEEHTLYCDACGLDIIISSASYEEE